MVFSKLRLRVDGDVLVVPNEVWREWPRRQAADGGPPPGLPLPGLGSWPLLVGETGDPNGFSLSNTGGTSTSGVLAAELPGEAGRCSSG